MSDEKKPVAEDSFHWCWGWWCAEKFIIRYDIKYANACYSMPADGEQGHHNNVITIWLPLSKYLTVINSSLVILKTSFQTKTKLFLSSRRLQTKTLVSKTTSLALGNSSAICNIAAIRHHLCAVILCLQATSQNSCFVIHTQTYSTWS